eukprot:gene6293-6153_t
MSLTLEHVSRTVEGQTWIDDACLRFEPGSFNVLLGRTLSGKTSLMRLMAGLDKPDTGRILMNGVDVTQRPVRLRNPNEALALGGTTTILHEGRVIQSGRSSEVYHQPQTVLAAELFSEPPINLMPGRIAGNEVSFANFVHFPLNVDLRPVGEGEFRFGVRPSHISLVPSNDDDLELAVTVEVAEISGSETFLHVRNEHFLLVLHLPGVHEYDVDAPIRIYIPTHKLFVFDAQGRLVQAPGRRNLAHSYTSTPSGPEDYAIRQMDHVWEQGGKRNIAQVFQFPVVYDTMTVFDNLAFPLRNQGMAEAKIHTKVREIAEVLDLQSLLGKKASNLTADEKQKVSMGRGLVRDDVSAILFDEPLTVIDPHLKWKLRRKLKQIHEHWWGAVQQRQIAEKDYKKLQVGIRPEFIHVWDEANPDALQADVMHIEDLGTYKILTLNLDGAPLKVRLAEDKPVPEGRASISFPAQWLMVYADDYLLEARP